MYQFTTPTDGPVAPSRSDSREVFAARGNAFFAWMAGLPTEFGVWSGQITAALNDVVTIATAVFRTTSTTSNTIGTGARTFTVETGRAYVPGQPLIIAHDAANYMWATVTSYSADQLVVDVTETFGSGPFASWEISLALNSAVLAPYATLAGTETLTGKTIDLASNTLAMTLAQLNAALSGADVATLAGAETLLNKLISGLNTNSTVLDPSGNPQLIGYRDNPPNIPDAGPYTLALGDRGKTVTMEDTCTIPAFADVMFPIGSEIEIYNRLASPITIDIDTDTLRLNGTSLTGPRQLAGYGLCTVHKPVMATEWVIDGPVT